MSGSHAKRRVYFKITEPEAEDVRLVGSFNDWEQEGRDLKRDWRGVWKTWMMLEPGDYEYRFVVDGEWRNDPEARDVANPFGTSNSLQVVG